MGNNTCTTSDGSTTSAKEVREAAHDPYIEWITWANMPSFPEHLLPKRTD